MLDKLQNQHTIFGEIVEGLEVIDKINALETDEQNRPFLNCRILHTLVIDDPFQDIHIDEDLLSPEYIGLKDGYLELEDYEKLKKEDPQQMRKFLEKKISEHNIETKKVVLEMIDVLPTFDAKPSENIIFICQLNKRTLEEDLETIFSQFGKIKKCDLVRDWKTGESLQYAFIEYETKRSAEEAYFKMQNCLIDNKRIHVDFSQSTNKMWNKYNTHRKKKREYFRKIRGVDNETETQEKKNHISLRFDKKDNIDLILKEERKKKIHKSKK